MAQVSVPNTFFNGGVADANAVNANFSAIYAAFNSTIDNTNVGVLGFYATQIIPTTPGNATFGGTQPYTFLTAVSGTALSLSGLLTASLGGLFGQGVSMPAAGQMAVITDGANGLFRLGSTAAYFFQNASGSATYPVNALQFIAGNSSLSSASLVVGGPVQAATISGVNTLLPGLYTAAGNGLTSNSHTVFGNTGVTTTTGAAGVLVGQTAVSLPSSMNFTNAGTYSVTMTCEAALMPVIYQKSATGFTILLYQIGNSVAAGTYFVDWVASGY